MQAPEQFLMGRRRILFALLATGVLALAAGLFFAHRPTPHTEIVWLSPAELTGFSHPGPWTRIKPRLSEVAGRVLPFLRPSRNQANVNIGVTEWHSSLAENHPPPPDHPPESTNADGVVAWEMSKNEIEKAMADLGLAPDGTLQSSRGTLGACFLVFPSGYPTGMHDVVALPLLALLEATAKYASGFNHILVAVTPPKASGVKSLPPAPSPIKSALGFRASWPNGDGVLLKVPGAGDGCWWMLIWAKAADNQGKLLIGPPTR